MGDGVDLSLKFMEFCVHDSVQFTVTDFFHGREYDSDGALWASGNRRSLSAEIVYP